MKESSVLKKTKEEYGSDFSSHLFEQYKLLVDSAQRNSDRRTTANNYLLTVNSVLLSFLGAGASIKASETLLAAVAAAGILVSATWWLLIDSYKKLNSAKFDVIHEFEEVLPAAPFKREWDIAEQRRYRPFTHLECYIPVIFAILYLALPFWLVIQ